MGNEYLTIEEQFKETVNDKEISRIKDPELIRNLSASFITEIQGPRTVVYLMIKKSG